MNKDYYSVLGVLPSAEDVVIRAAYRALAQRYHPDKWADQLDANRRMKEINEAYETLSDSGKRRKYDAERATAGKKETLEPEDDSINSAFQDAESSQKSDWQVAVEYYPDLEEIKERLGKTSSMLAFAFQSTVLETKKFKDRLALAGALELSFLQTYFGSNPHIVEFAKLLIRQGRKEAARELNRAINVLGSDADSELVISRISKNFCAPKRAPASAKELRILAETVLSRGWINDVTTLIEALGGQVLKNKNANLGVFQYTLTVYLRIGETYSFESEYALTLWAKDELAPKVMAGEFS